VMTFVIPKTTDLLIESGAKLPLLTRVLISFSNFFRSNSVFIAVAIIGAIVGFWYLVKKSDDGKRILDWIKIKMPIFGEILKMIYMVRITRSFATLLKGGVPINDALKSVSDVVGNQIYKDILLEAVKAVDEGDSLSESLSEHEEIPLMVSQIINVGEESGQLEETLGQLTHFYTREINNRIANLSSLIEPLIMIVMGIAVGGFVAAVIMPMWELSAVY
jgi:type IV pilus assembly protein PilC